MHLVFNLKFKNIFSVGKIEFSKIHIKSLSSYVYHQQAVQKMTFSWIILHRIPANTYLSKVNNRDTRTTSVTLFWSLYCYLQTSSTSFSNFSFVEFEQILVCWDHSFLKAYLNHWMVFVIFLKVARNTIHMTLFSFFFYFFW